MPGNQKQHKTWWDENEKVIRLQVFGNYDDQDAQNNVNGVAAIKQKFPGEKLKFLIDLAKATTPSSKARKIIVEKVYKDPDLGRISAVTPSLLVRTVNSFMIKASRLGSDKVRMFATEEEALKWLKED